MTKRFFQRQHTWFDVLIVWLLIALIAVATHADTPAPGVVKAKVQDGAGNPIGSTSGALNVNVTNSGTSLVNQGNAGVQAWLFDLSTLFGAAPSATNYLPSRISNGSTFVDPTQIRALNSGTDSVTISGSVTATNSANGAPGSAAPAQATQVAGSDGVSLRALKVSASGVLSVDGSASTQPVSGSVAVTNFPGVQPVSQSGTWTVQQGTPPWSTNLTQLNGSAPGATNALASRITNGTSFVDPTQIRALTSGTDSVNIGNFPATQPVSGTVTANAGTGTFTVGQATGTNLHTVVDNFPATTAVTQSTSPWVVSGTVTANQGGAPWSISLPTGASTSALQTTGNSSLASIDSKLTSPLSVAQSGTWNITNISGTVSLPTGASTAANQASQLTQETTTATNTTSILANQTNGTQKTKITDGTNVSTLIANGDGTYSVSVAQSNTLFIFSASNFNASTITNGSTFTSVCEGNTGQQAASFLLHSTQALAFTFNQYIDAACTIQAASNAYTVPANGVGFSAAIVFNGNFAQWTVANSSGSSATVTANVAYGTLPSANQNGNLPVAVNGLNSSQVIRNDYSSNNVTTAAYFQLVALTTDNIQKMLIFDSSGQDFVLATGAAGSEVDQINIPPGGWDVPVELFIPKGSRVSIKAKSATASSGLLLITGLK